MKIESVKIENFRCFSNETVLFDNYTCLIGPNGAGKSSVLGALNVLFRNGDTPFEVGFLSLEDFHRKDTSQPVRITATFCDLSKRAREDLKAYVRQEKLIVSAIAEWDEGTERAEVRQVGSRLVVPRFAEFFEALERSARVAELKEIFARIRKDMSDVPSARTKDEMQTTLREYEEAHGDLCELVESSDRFYGWSRGANLLEQHYQWIYVPAVKDPADEQNESKGSALGRLLQRTIRARVDFSDAVAELRARAAATYKDLLEQEAGVLDDVSKALGARLQEWANPEIQVELQWNYDDQKSVRIEEPMARVKIGEDGFLGDLIRLGHGVQRAFLVSLLQELVDEAGDENPTLGIAIEEPELYQHPPQARHFAAVLEQHASGGAQVMVTSHSPYFVSGRGFESVRMTRKRAATGDTRITQLSHADLGGILEDALGSRGGSPSSTMAAVEQIMQPSQSEMFFSRVPVFVEGPEDVAFLSTHLHLSGQWNEFRRYGCHFVVCSGKANMSRPVAIARGLGIPFFCVFDGDANRCTDPSSRAQHERDNRCLISLCNGGAEPIPSETHWASGFVMWKNQIRGAVIDEVGDDVWVEAEQAARERRGLYAGVRPKNAILVGATIEELWGTGTKVETLARLSRAVLDFAREHQGG